MDDGSTTEAERWLNTAAKLLASGDFHGTRTFAIRARESAPVLADQILAVTDTLLTAQANPRDWYGILQLVPLTQSMEVVESQYRKLAILLNPVTTMLSFADQAFRFVSEAWNVLSNPSKKLIYDNELRFLQFGHVSPLGQEHYQHQQPQLQQLQTQTQPLFMQPPPPPQPKEMQTQVTQSFFVRSPGNNNAGNAALEGGEQLGLNNYSAESTWTRQTNQTGLTQPSQINQTGSVGSSRISWPEPTRTSQINQSEPIGANQINQAEFNQTEPIQSGQFNHSATPAPTKDYSRTEPTGATQDTDSIRASQDNESEGPANDSTPASQSTQSEGSTFWTACPHCYSRFEYPKVYENCTLRCQTKDCRKAFRAVVIPSPPVQTEPTGVSWNTYSTQASQFTESAGPTFWTACPYCYVLYEYPKVYEDYTLRCQAKNCRRAFHAVVIRSPPVNGSDTNFCCWGFLPIARNDTFPSWSPISAMFACPDNKNAGKPNITKNSALRVFYDERDTYAEISDSSASSDDDDDRRNVRREKKVSSSKGKGSRGRNAKKPQGERVKQGSNDQVNADHGGNLSGVSMVPEGVPTAESSRRGVTNSGRNQMKRGTKVFGKLDLNVEFRNEVEDSLGGRSKGNHAGNEEDNNEGNGFFEGLDEIFSSLPILSVVGDDKVKATE